MIKIYQTSIKYNVQEQESSKVEVAGSIENYSKCLEMLKNIKKKHAIMKKVWIQFQFSSKNTKLRKKVEIASRLLKRPLHFYVFSRLQ